MPQTSNFSKATMISFRRAAKKIAEAAEKMVGDQGKNLRMIGEEIMTDVKASAPGHGVPVDSGALRSTGKVDGPLGSKAEPEVVLGFGDAAVKYALIQHERTDYHHPVGESRYLVRGLERWRPGGSAAVAAIRKNAQEGIRAVGEKS